MTVAATLRVNPNSRLLGSEPARVRDRYHSRAQREAEGLPFEGPEWLAKLFREDPAFADLVAVYRGRL